MGDHLDGSARSATTDKLDAGFCLRTPLLPSDVLLAWAAQPEHFLDEVYARLELREALFVASPQLHDIVARGPGPVAGRAVRLALARYLARMCGRATPFGLFSGVSVGRTGTRTALELAPRRDYRRRTRVDNDHLFSVVTGLLAQPDVRATVRLRPNDSLYAIAEQLRYVEARLTGKERSYHLVAVERTPALDATLERCRDGATPRALAEALVADDAEIALDEALAFVAALVDAQVVVADLGVAVTGREPIDELVDRLVAQTIAAPAGVLAGVRDALAELDAGGVGQHPDRYVAIATALAELPAKVELARLFQVDMVKPATATLGGDVTGALARTIEWLRAITPRSGDAALDRFRTAFAARYEGRAVPLTEVLDDEHGIGFEASGAPGAAAAPLLAGLRFPGQPQLDTVPRDAFHRHMRHRLATAVAAGAREIVLGDDDRKALAADDPQSLPDAYDATVRLGCGDDGKLELLVMSAAGPSGARLLGRFCHASADIDAMVRAHLRAEEALRPDAVFAEIVHLNEGRIGNVICRPVLRGHEIAFLGVSGADRDHRIDVSDLLVSLRDGRIVLTSRRLGREVVPRMTNAHNYALRTVSIYRFLCALQGTRGVMWAWGGLAGEPYLPRVRVGSVLVARAAWNLIAADLDAITRCVRARADAAAAVAELRARAKLPRFVVISDGDNELPIDFDNALLVEVFADEVAGRDQVRLYEMFPLPGASPVRGPEGAFANEVVTSFVRPATAPTAATSEAAAAPASCARSFAPGTTWLYAKLYCGASTADRVLRAASPVVRDALDSGDAASWFFVRYADPDNHVRLRFHGEPTRLIGRVLPALTRAIEPLRADGSIWRVQLDTYEREVERYGGDHGIELCEQVFRRDSDAVLAIVDTLEGDAGADARWRLALAGAESLLVALGLDANARHRVFADARDMLAREHRVEAAFFAPIGERYKRERAALEALFAPDLERDRDHDLAPGLVALAARDRAIAGIAAQLRERDAAGELQPRLVGFAWSLVHMHVNRLLHGAHRAQELVLYDLLRRLHDARRARAKVKP